MAAVSRRGNAALFAQEEKTRGEFSQQFPEQLAYAFPPHHPFSLNSNSKNLGKGAWLGGEMRPLFWRGTAFYGLGWGGGLVLGKPLLGDQRYSVGGVIPPFSLV